MEIKNYASAINVYRLSADSAGEKISSRKSKDVKARSNTDKAEFSNASRTSFSDSLKAAAKNAADSSASAERLRALSAQISSGAYSVSSEDVANAIIGL